MINDACNLKCEYCFAEDCKKFKREMSIEDFKKALDFCATGSSRVGIIGGEPTLHSNINEILQVVQDDDRFEQAVLFTNGSNIDKVIDTINVEDNKIGILVNLNPPTVGGATKPLYEKSLEGIDLLLNSEHVGENITIGINIYKEEQDIEYLLDIINTKKFEAVRMSIAVPNTDDKRSIDSFEYYQRLKPIALKIIGAAATSGNCGVAIDCSFIPPCLYTDEEKAFLYYCSMRLVKNGFLDIRDKINSQNCTPVLDILPDLKIVRCFGTSCEAELDMDTPETVDEAYQYFLHRVDYKSYYRREPQCLECKKHLLGECNGGCMAFF